MQVAFMYLHPLSCIWKAEKLRMRQTFLSSIKYIHPYSALFRDKFCEAVEVNSGSTKPIMVIVLSIKNQMSSERHRLQNE